MHIFISYAQKDTHDLAVKLRDIFTRIDGLTVWMDELIQGGDDWSSLIDQEIDKCDLFLVLVSQDINRKTKPGSYVIREIQYAQQAQKIILPVLAQATKVPSLIVHLQRFDLTQNETVETGKLVDELCHRAGIQSPAEKCQIEKAEKQRQMQEVAKTKADEESRQRQIVPEAKRKAEGEERQRKAQSEAKRKVEKEKTKRWKIKFYENKELPHKGLNRLAVISAVTLTITSVAVFASGILRENDGNDSKTNSNNLLWGGSYRPDLNGKPQAYFIDSDGNQKLVNTDWVIEEQDSDGVTMVKVPAGCFMMGSEDEKPIHRVCIDVPFWIDKYEVSNAQFDGNIANNGNSTDGNLPKVNITWFEARDFCAEREARLPTEAEWEYAARGPESWIYPWGNDFVAENVVYTGNSDGALGAVDSRPNGVSWVGAYHMSGNVWEWVSSLYQGYPYDSQDGREPRVDTTSSRVLRGGSLQDNDIYLRSSLRIANRPDGWYYNSGFRCARSSQ